LEGKKDEDCSKNLALMLTYEIQASSWKRDLADYFSNDRNENSDIR